MIINNYLADKNTPEMLKVSGVYRFDSWTNVNNIYVYFQTDGIPFYEAKDLSCKFGYLLEGNSNISNLLTLSLLKDNFTIANIMLSGTNGDNVFVQTLMNESFGGRKLGDINNDGLFDGLDIEKMFYYAFNFGSSLITDEEKNYIKYVLYRRILSDFNKYSIFINMFNEDGYKIYEGDSLPDKIGTGYTFDFSDETTNLQIFQDYVNVTSKFYASIIHSGSIETSIDYISDKLIYNKYYKISYTVTGLDGYGFGIYVMVGSNKGEVRKENGNYVEYIQLKDVKKISFFASGNVELSKVDIKEYFIISDALDFTDVSSFIDNSWTISYSFDANCWVSFHSFIPDYYITSNKNFYSVVNDELSTDFSIRDEANNYIVDSDNAILVYNLKR